MMTSWWLVGWKARDSVKVERLDFKIRGRSFQNDIYLFLNKKPKQRCFSMEKTKKRCLSDGKASKVFSGGKPKKGRVGKPEEKESLTTQHQGKSVFRMNQFKN
jgi:hypothetical protein